MVAWLAMPQQTVPDLVSYQKRSNSYHDMVLDESTFFDRNLNRLAIAQDVKDMDMVP